ncbi:MAG TPA: winged helix-turn-helix domain-containing protein [Kofleriaceae bacterium]|nr:winged helix-turn-helix domain-containing protein [Kofleriaceae bacterium]
MSTLAVVEEILRETAVPMSVREIVERAGARLPSKSKTPDTVVARDLSMDIKKKGDGSLFVRTSPGRYTLRSLATLPAPVAAPPADATQLAPTALRSHNVTPLPARKPAAPAAPARPSGRSDSAEGGGYVS